jgi:hypothetical protein
VSTTQETVVLLAEVLEYRRSALEAMGQPRDSKALLVPRVVHDIIGTMKARFEEEPEQKQACARDSALPKSSQNTRRRSRFSSMLYSRFGGLLWVQLLLSTGECNSMLVDLVNSETQQIIQTKAGRRMEGQNDDPSSGSEPEEAAHPAGPALPKKSLARQAQALRKKARYAGNLVARALGGLASSQAAPVMDPSRCGSCWWQPWGQPHLALLQCRLCSGYRCSRCRRNDVPECVSCPLRPNRQEEAPSNALPLASAYAWDLQANVLRLNRGADRLTKAAGVGRFRSGAWAVGSREGIGRVNGVLRRYAEQTGLQWAST